MTTARLGNVKRTLAASIGTAAISLSCASGQTVPDGFTHTTLEAGFGDATSIAITPDGRVLIAKQNGVVQMWKDGDLLEEPVHTFATTSFGEAGLIGIAVHPSFAANGFVYAYNVNDEDPPRGKLLRFTMPPGSDTSAPGSQVELFDLGVATSIHLGGEVQVGADGKLYVALGDHANSSNAQSLSSIFGKILRLNPDGSIPSDNPFFGTTAGDNRAIWAWGLRNPFTFAFDATNGLMYINDVGAGTWEEINEGAAGRNFGWPETEGPFNPATFPDFVNPVLAYHHNDPGEIGFTGSVITGGVFYRPAGQQFPADYVGDYFFGDLGGSWVRRLDVASGESVGFASGMSGVVDFAVQPDGALLVLRRNVLSLVTYDAAVGACCIGSACTQVTSANCASSGGVFEGVGISCGTAGNPIACCPANFDQADGVEVPDIFAFLGAWFAEDPSADFDGMNGIEVPDIFAFLSAWFAGCGA